MKSSLIELLKKETQTLKVQFVEKSKEFAKKQFDLAVERKNWKEVDYCKYFNIEPRPVNVGTSSEFLSFPKNFYNTKESKEYYKLRNLYHAIVSMGLDAYVSKSEKSAIEHYESSIEKLAYRISQKDLNEDNLTLDTSHVGVNIETFISDGKKTVRAFTIMAWGEIQKPHYRYLIK